MLLLSISVEAQELTNNQLYEIGQDEINNVSKFFDETSDDTNKKNALFFIQRDTGNAYADSQYMLGDFYWNGFGIQDDKDVIMKRLKKSADQGVTKAINILNVISKTKPEMYDKFINKSYQVINNVTTKDYSSPLNSPVTIFSYIARVGLLDHFNSKGQPLDNVPAIIRQERANYHRGIVDEDDRKESLFGDLEMRNYLEEIAKKSDMSPDVKNEIINGNPIIKVSISKNSNNECYIVIDIM